MASANEPASRRSPRISGGALRWVRCWLAGGWLHWYEGDGPRGCVEAEAGALLIFRGWHDDDAPVAKAVVIQDLPRPLLGLIHRNAVFAEEVVDELVGE